MPTVLILGANAGIGRALAVEFAWHQYRFDSRRSRFGGTGRTCPGSESAPQRETRAEKVDVVNIDALESALAACISPAGDSLEGAVLCAGYLGDPETHQSDLAEARRILDTNFTGSALALSILANHFEASREGFICALSSVAGDRGRQSNYLYGLGQRRTDDLSPRLAQPAFSQRVQVITVKPGFVDTRMVFGNRKLPLVAAPERRCPRYLRR